ncbi:hypothetical protein ACFW9F_01815 [Streptomyces sp. NPDC059506]|uniref:Uncharacterized protein n=1 Tax=Streptomyces thermolineatus TaxID=44033 RepID=A0ABN3MEL6_9ACTN
MDLDDVGMVLAAVTALRVFAADSRRLMRRLLGAGVRVGAEHLARTRTDNGSEVEDR